MGSRAWARDQDQVWFVLFTGIGPLHLGPSWSRASLDVDQVDGGPPGDLQGWESWDQQHFVHTSETGDRSVPQRSRSPSVTGDESPRRRPRVSLMVCKRGFRRGASSHRLDAAWRTLASPEDTGTWRHRDTAPSHPVRLVHFRAALTSASLELANVL